MADEGDLTKTSFTFGMDDVGLEYCELSHNETQNHQNVYEGPQTRPRMYEMPEDDLCPIKSMKLYLSKLDPASDLFYTYPITSKNWKPADKIWYTIKQIGKNSIGDFMKKISKRLQLSRLYTNHEIRHTTVTVLSNAGFPTRDIMNLTKHRNEKSIKSYVRDSTTCQKRAVSDTLARVATGHSKAKQIKTTSTSATYTRPVPPPSNKQQQRMSATELFNLNQALDNTLAELMPDVSRSTPARPTYTLDDLIPSRDVSAAATTTTVPVPRSTHAENIMTSRSTSTSSNTTSSSTYPLQQIIEDEINHRSVFIRNNPNCTINIHMHYH